ncbi:hypothetical protein GALMADRAFT_231848 [Galerina marginata CBS 339.88]|uniref:F-box domain-containing protein n=1 Tax=Galerina marginata (strain CBS 339.88) TaxID=685588 RepID=A0A067SCF5_GALM3|nr:hypothetical protein GALMADRAFT_231848 [Galerina marginata CBS 339.88]
MSGLNLAHLPFDIYAVICSFLHPMDIITIGQACKSLHFVFSTRSIWVDALRRTMSANSIFGHTLHRASDSSDPITLEELQHASTAPLRMLRLIESKQEKKYHKNRILRPFYRTMVHLPVDTRSGTNGKSTINKIYIVPGGRYVIVNAGDTLMVIDLERFFNLGGTEPGRYTAFCSCQSDKNFLVAPSPDGTRLRVVVMCSLFYIPVSDMLFRFDDFTVYEYDPSSHELSVLNSVSLQTDRIGDNDAAPSLCGNIFVFFLNSVVYVWDFVRELYASWKVDIPEVQEIIIADDKIIPIAENSLGIWQIPPLVSASPVEPSSPTEGVSAILPKLYIRVPRIGAPTLVYLTHDYRIFALPQRSLFVVLHVLLRRRLVLWSKTPFSI